MPFWVSASITRWENTSPPSESRLRLHAVAIDHELVDHRGQSIEARSPASPWRRARCSARPRKCEMSRSCHSVTFSSAGIDGAAHHAGEPRQVLGQHRVALVRHRRAALLAGGEELLRLRTSVRCRWRISVARFSIEAATTASAAKNMAWRSRGITCVETGSTARPSFLATCSSTRGSTLAKVPTGAGDGAGRDLGPRCDQPGAVAGEGGVVAGQLHAEGRGLGMDAVAAADGRACSCAPGRAA